MRFVPVPSAILVTTVLALVPATLPAATHVVTLSQTLDAQGKPVCDVTPMRVDVSPGDDVEFEMTTEGKAKKAKIKKKKDDPGKVKFGNPPPWEAEKNKPANSGSVQRDGGDSWEYDVVFKKNTWWFPEVCTVDPVICIKDDATESPDPETSSEDDGKRLDDPCT